ARMTRITGATGSSSHGYSDTTFMFCASLSMTPQDTIGGRSPRPRKDSAVSPRIIDGIVMVAEAMRCEMKPGMGGRSRMRGEPADGDAEHEGDRDADEPHRQRDARAVDDAREEVAPEPVRSPQEQRRIAGWAEDVPAPRDQPPEPVGVAVAEEAQAFDPAGV